MSISSQFPLPAKIKCLVLNLGGAAEHLAVTNLSGKMIALGGFSLRVDQQRAAIADLGERSCRKFQQIQWYPSTVDFLVSRGIFPLSSVVVIFADRLGGYITAARIVAGLCRFSPIVGGIVPPSLIVLSTAPDCTLSAFAEAVTTEFLDMHRDQHPELSYSVPQIQQMWTSRFSSVDIVKRAPSQSWGGIINEAKSISGWRVNRGFGISERQFSRLLQHTVEAFNPGSDIQFSTLQAFGIHNPITSAAKTNLKALLEDRNICGKKRVALAASCIAVNAYRCEACGKSPVVKRRAKG